MRKEVIYIAEDGKRFNSKEECEKYETYILLSEDFIKKNNILFFDKNFENVSSHLEDYEFLEDFINRVDYIYIEKEELIDKLNEKFISYSFPPIENKEGKGWYAYNYDANTWVNLTAKKEFIDNILQKLPH